MFYTKTFKNVSNEDLIKYLKENPDCTVGIRELNYRLAFQEVREIFGAPKEESGICIISHKDAQDIVAGD